METLDVEIISKYEGGGDCAELLYAPLDADLTFRQTQVYHLEFTGDAAAAEKFVRDVLFDPFSEEIHLGGGEAIDSPKFTLEFGMKPGALDLEKEAIVGYYSNLDSPAFTLESLTLRQRIYVFGEGADPAPFVRDVVNPAIHTWEVAHV